MNFLREDASNYFEWDIYNWSRALRLWAPKILELKKKGTNLKGLEIGGRHGGLSLMLANEFKIKMTLTDLQISTKQINFIKNHDKFDLITFDIQDVMELSYDSEQYDLIIFKSVLGSLGNAENQIIALSEIHRCLKPGGVVLVAENLRSTWLHSLLRYIFNPWSRYNWYYPTKIDFSNSLDLFFSEKKIQHFGFIGLFSRKKRINYFLSRVDLILSPLIPNSWKYIVFGWGSK